ncbi:MAG: FAD-dependent oxidoreductase [Planctomycetota bacterium]
MDAPTRHDDHFDVAVVGAGFGGIGAALACAERGRRVVLLEKMTYPGGCAATFRHRGRPYEAGATLSAGFGEGQLFRTWIARYGLDLDLRDLDPIVSFRAPSIRLEVPRDRELFVTRLAEREGARAESVRRFFARQRRVADLLWPLLDDPRLLPPLGVGGLFGHLRRAPRYLGLLSTVGRDLDALLVRSGLGSDPGLRVLLDAICRITLQAGVDEVEAPFALAALDYFFRGSRHVVGGLGRLAEELLRAFTAAGGTLRLADGVRGIARDGRGFRVVSRRGSLQASVVVSNLLPDATRGLLDEPLRAEARGLADREREVRAGWGAAMLYLDVSSAALEAEGARHLELVDREDEALIEGNHVFCSIGDGDAGGERPVTVSTHVRMDELLGRPESERGLFIGAIQDRMRATLRARAPRLAAAIVREMTASPRTFARFTGRPDGFVGGVPRRRGFRAYRITAAPRLARGLHLVGDSVFPGQSILACALGGAKVAERIGAD